MASVVKTLAGDVIRGKRRGGELIVTRFNQCPNCGHKPSGSIFSGTHFDIYECKKCGKCYCYKCGDKRCPDCGSKERSKAGECWKRD